MKLSVQFLLALLAALLYVNASNNNECRTFSCGCCCSRDQKPCCNPGYRGGDGKPVLAYNDGYVLDPEEEATATLFSPSVMTPNNGDDGYNGNAACKLSCVDTYREYKGKIHNILGIKKSVTCSFPTKASASTITHKWKTQVENLNDQDIGGKRCFTIFDLGGVNRKDRAVYLQQIISACFQKEAMSCPDLEQQNVDSNFDEKSPAYDDYYQMAIN